jgi:hypothetical protein
MEYRLVRNDELYHYGVPGMRWGHRKAVPDSYTSSKARYKAAKRAFNRSHSRAYNYSAFHLMSQFTNPKKKAKADRLWEQAKKDGKNFNAAQKEYKREKASKAKTKNGAKIANKLAAKNAKVSYKEAKANLNAAKRRSNKSFTKAYNYSAFHLMSQFTDPNKKNKADRLWGQEKKDAKALDKAQKDYKKAKTAYKKAKRG